jgi:outer membrane protein assembly factor BamB
MKTKLILVGCLLIFLLACGIATPQRNNNSQENDNEPIVTVTEVTSTDASLPTEVQPSVEPINHKPYVVHSIDRSSHAIVDTTAFASYEEKIKAVNLIDGNVLWEIEYKGNIIGADEDFVYVSPSSRRLDALDPKTGDFVWRALLEAGVILQVYTTDNAIYIGAGKLVFSVDKTDGKITGVWRSEWSRTMDDYAFIYWYDQDSKLTAYEANTNNPIWDLKGSTQYLWCEEILVYTERNNKGKATAADALELFSGNILWRFEIPEYYSVEPISCFKRKPFFSKFFSFTTRNVVKSESDNVYFVVSDGPRDFLLAIDRLTGMQKWLGDLELSQPEQSNFQWLGEINNKILYSHRGYGITQAYSADDHKLLWENSQVVLSDILGDSNGVLVGTTDFHKSIVGINNEGNTIWEYVDDDVSIYTPIVSGWLIFPSGTKHFFIHPETGEVSAEFKFGDDNIYFEAIGDMIVASSVGFSDGKIWVIHP